ncbi:3-oxo-5a-steroid 4- dehydrogenase [Tulasnella sp. 427]|nr:3-oxo-5a-steroid 4- dehydrogenase [Tulasnella sp. 427]
MPTVKIDYANGKKIPTAKALPMSLTFQPTDTIADVKKDINRHFPRFPVTRQRLSLASKEVLHDERTIGSLTDNVTLFLKDLGPQISWRTVYMVEYAGPLLVAPLFYHCPQLYGKGAFKHSEMQTLVYSMVMLHYLKREFETVFVHRFSHATMPAFNIIKNSAHYWLLSGLLLCGSTFAPWYSAANLSGTLRDNSLYLKGLTAVWAFAELSNLICHITLRNLRPAGTRQRAIPYGYGFNSISCPNYTFETLAWTTVLALTWDPAVAIFLVVGTVQMVFWAIKKHKNYKKEFGKEYPKRWVMFPFIF